MELRRTKKGTLAVLAACAAGAFAPARAAESSALLWPAKLRPAVSSNFCEYRDGHLHAGLDIRTFGEEGIACVAGDTGYVSRVRASAEGYGKALYVQLDTGLTLVYAHLAEFAPEIEAAVDEEQTRRGRYTIDVRFPPSRFPVQRGDVIGYSGMTGANAPHLHFEVRNAQEHPLDPLAAGIRAEDALSPAFGRVAFLPLEPGAWGPFAHRSAERAPGSYEVCDTLVLSGATGVAVEVVDFLNGESGRLAPSEITLAVDGRPVARVALDSFSFAHADEVDFVYEPASVRVNNDYFFQLYDRRGATLWHRDFADGGRVAPCTGAPGQVHEGRVTARDRAGNAAELVFHFLDASAEDPTAWPAGRCGGEIPWDDEVGGQGFFFEDFATLWGAGRPVDEWRARLGQRGIAWEPGAPLRAADLSAVPVELPDNAHPDAPGMWLFAIARGQSRSVSLSALGLELVFGERSLYTDAVLYAREWRELGTAAARGELVQRGLGVRLGPYSLALRADLEIRFIVEGSDSADAVYRLNEDKGEWVYYPSVASGVLVSTTARRPGVYAVFADRLPPKVRQPFLSTRRSYATGVSVPEIVVPIEDAGSGVDYERTAIYVDGVRRIARWDAVAKKMFVPLGDQNIIEPLVVSAVVFDRVGNRTRADATLAAPPRR